MTDEHDLLKLDLELRRKHVVWETPRNIAIVVGVAVALAGLVFGTLGYKIAQTPPQEINVSGAIQLLPSK